LERVVDKRVTKYGKKTAVEYPVKFKGWGSQWNEWYLIELLDNAIQSSPFFPFDREGWTKR
jgi:hypothetical protein